MTESTPEPELSAPSAALELAPAPMGTAPALVTDEEWDRMARIAQTVSNTEFVPKGLRGNGVKTMACLLYGHAQGLNPMVALTELYVVDGKVGMSAAFIVGKIRSAGHKVSREAHLDEEGETVAITAHGERSDGTKDSFTFTLKMAERADLLKGVNWQKYPEAMLWARAVSQLGRMLFSDVFLGQSIYDSEELREADVVEGEVIEAKQAEEPNLLTENPLVANWDVHSAAEARVLLRSFDEEELVRVRELEQARRKPRRRILTDIDERLANLRGSAPPEPPQEPETAVAGEGAESDASPPAADEVSGAGEAPPGDEAPTQEAESSEAGLDTEAPVEPATDEPPAQAQLASEERPEVVKLRAYIEKVKEKYPLRAEPWEEQELVKTATRAFKREISSFADMTEEEVGRLVAGLPQELRDEVDAELEEETT